MRIVVEQSDDKYYLSLPPLRFVSLPEFGCVTATGASCESGGTWQLGPVGAAPGRFSADAYGRPLE